MKNIVLVGLKYDNNLGDQVINHVSRHILAEVWSSVYDFDVEIRDVDMTGREGIDYNPTKKSYAKLYHFLLLCGLPFINDKLTEYINCRTVQSFFSRVIDNDTIAVIFGGGGLIKYKVQNLSLYIDEITKIADKNNIPVMFSAVGVEGYDESDWKCLRLKRAINRQAVKVISTRDDVETLKKKYCKNNQIILRAADPACSVYRLLPPQRMNNSVKTIGLGMVRKDLFLDYGIEVSEEKLLRLWTDIYHLLSRKGYICKVFCNGARSDERFMLKWAEYMGFSEEQRAEILVQRPESAKGLIQIIQGFSGVVVARLHASIIAYSYGIPFTALVWNKKQLFFGEQIGCPERFIESKDFNGEYIVNTLELAIREGYHSVDKDAYCRTTVNAMEVFINKYVHAENKK